MRYYARTTYSTNRCFKYYHSRQRFEDSMILLSIRRNVVFSVIQKSAPHESRFGARPCRTDAGCIRKRRPSMTSRNRDPVPPLLKKAL
ncbi:hypothetical protein CEXT_297961 [Caerostris extrusa]|uniref:Uncharacterized protein n=1 Tax=Caerostris extrusa TaxID=172846 RepID=A0AAV4XRL4_CAEEX|nr:hypothetical protein CEXT_297961 [Caerostris extrusa]